MTHERSHFWKVTLITCTIENVREFQGFVAIHESFLREIGGAWHLFGSDTKRAICESFLRENLIFHQFTKVFSLESFPLYSHKSSNSLPIPKVCVGGAGGHF